MRSYHPKLIEHMIEETPKSVVGVMFVSLIWLCAYVSYVPIKYLILWALLQIIYLLFRFKNAQTLKKLIENNETLKLEKHTKYFFISILLSAALWNVAAILGLLFAPIPYGMLTLLMIVGTVTAAVLSLGSLYAIYVSYFSVMFVPQFFIMLSYGDTLHYFAAVLVLAYVPFVLPVTKAMYDNQIENIRMHDSLQSKIDELHTLTITDFLTNTYTKRYFFDTAKSRISLSMRDGTPLSLLMIDIDHFKKVNDSYGHQAGDVILIGFAQELQSLIRDSDILARIGGEEFAILLHNTSNNDAIKIAQKIRQTIEEKVFIYDEIKIPVTVSIGTSELAKNITCIEDLYRDADDNLYLAKKNGRNRVN